MHLADGIHVIEFEHGTTSGSRVLRVDRQVRPRLDSLKKSKFSFENISHQLSFSVGV